MGTIVDTSKIQRKLVLMTDQFQLSGEWNSHKEHCSFGYQGVWEIRENREDLVVREIPGSKCCFCVPNCFPKTHRMKKINENEWRGTCGWKTVSITRISDNKLSHMTTDGLFTLTRD